MNDLVVVLPGIMGSALYKNGEPVWDPTIGGLVNALKALGRSITRLTLPEGIADNPPDDGVTAPHLVDDVHVIPGLWTPIRGYTRLLATLTANGYTEEAGNLLPLPYDWRTSIPCIVKIETPRIDTALEQWRARPGNTNARLVFIAHSMGGLVARHYATSRRGEVRKIITMGTPSRGSVNALNTLINGVGPNWGWLQNLILPFARSLPGLHHLLPAYPCVDTGGSYQDFAFLDAHNINELDPSMATAGLGFLKRLALTEANDPDFAKRLQPIIGWNQETLNSVRITDGVPRFLTSYGSLEMTGDGTVPLAGAAPKGLPLDSGLFHGFPDLHGNLQDNKNVRAELIRILKNAPPIVLRGDTIPLNLRLPDLLQEGQDLTVTVTLPPISRENVQITRHYEGRNITRRPTITNQTATTTFKNLPPGIHTITATGTTPGSSMQPVTGTVTVWSRAWEENFD